MVEAGPGADQGRSPAVLSVLRFGPTCTGAGQVRDLLELHGIPVVAPAEEGSNNMIRDILGIGGLLVAAVSGWVIEPASTGLVIGAAAFFVAIIVMSPRRS